MAGTVFEWAVTSVKVIYFTLFYARVMHDESLAPDIREELESYLKLNEEGPNGKHAGATANTQ